ncbi:MEDS domain-containing protein [Methanoculleus thermophilus]|uniref:MEDS domain-containing protein n=1 Tax=Methanoculleus thermophilus TaxID=2200 RepID=UPI003D8D6D40
MTESYCPTDLPEISWGTHACLFYQNQHEIVKTLVPYVQSGLDQDAYCLCIATEPLPVDSLRKALARRIKDLDRRLRRGEIEILDIHDWYLRGGKFSCSTALENCLQKGLDAQERGYEGMFITGILSWLTEAEWDAFMNYETSVNRTIGDCRIAALCDYSLETCGPCELLEVASRHQVVIIRRDDGWQQISMQDEPASFIEQSVIDQLETNIGQFATLADRIRHPLQMLMAIADLHESEHSETIRKQVQSINAVVRQLDAGWADTRVVRGYLLNHDLARSHPGSVRGAGSCLHPSGYPDSHQNS